MERVYFIAVKKFGPEQSGWEEFISWSGLTQVTRVATLDHTLCAEVISNLKEEDWKYNVHEDFMTTYFQDPYYLRQRVADIPDCQILGVVIQPTSEVHALLDSADFEFAGYDLLEAWSSTSALLNCGGFPDAFENAELNSFGLLPNFERALSVQHMLKIKYPEEPHADCQICALWCERAGKTEL